MLLVLLIKSLFTRGYKIINKNILNRIFISMEISGLFFFYFIFVLCKIAHKRMVWHLQCIFVNIKIIKFMTKPQFDPQFFLTYVLKEE